MRHLAQCVLLLLVLGCSASDHHPGPSLPTGSGAHVAEASGPGAHVGEVRELAVHAALVLEVDDVRESYAAVRAAIAEHGGWIARGSDGAGSAATIDARVPRPRLPALRSAIAELGAVTSDTEDVEDLSAVHVDLSARIRSARATEERLLALLADRTASLADVLVAERELSRVRESIEQLEAQERAIAARVESARIEVKLRWPPPVLVAFDEDPLRSIAGAFADGARSTRARLVAAAMAIAARTPMASAALIVLVPLALIARALRRRLA